jgi:hypothetical protein
LFLALVGPPGDVPFAIIHRPPILISLALLVFTCSEESYLDVHDRIDPSIGPLPVIAYLVTCIFTVHRQQQLAASINITIDLLCFHYV